MRETAVEFKHKQLFAGEVFHKVRLDVAAGTYKRGTLLTTADGKAWAAATAVELNKHYAICEEEIVLEAEGTVAAVKKGYFNKHVVEVNGAEASADDVKILKTVDIFVVDTVEQ